MLHSPNRNLSFGFTTQLKQAVDEIAHRRSDI